MPPRHQITALPHSLQLSKPVETTDTKWRLALQIEVSAREDGGGHRSRLPGLSIGLET